MVYLTVFSRAVACFIPEDIRDDHFQMWLISKRVGESLAELCFVSSLGSILNMKKRKETEQNMPCICTDSHNYLHT